MKTKLFLKVFLFISLFFSYSTSFGQLNVEKTKQSMKDAFTVLSNHELDKYANYIAEDAVDYASPEPIKGKIAIMNNLKSFFDAFPDYKVTLEDVAISGNRVYVRNTFVGTQTKPFINFPVTGKMIKWSDTDIFELDKNGKIAAHWANNPNEPLYQLGFGAFVNPNTSVVLTAYEAFGKGDIAGILATCTDDIVFDITDAVFLPKGMVYKSKTEVTMFFQFLKDNVVFTKFEPYRFLADGDDVVAYIKGEYKDLKTGKICTANIVHQFKFVNGKVASLKGTTDVPKDVMMASKN
jgi:predicted ester cyclase/ketosteroid isomerase-like protein